MIIRMENVFPMVGAVTKEQMWKMRIENCVFVDHNTDIVENLDNYFGFNRSNWEVIIN